MPVYEYRCNHCRHEFEKLVFRDDEENASCPQCRSDDVKKILSAATFMGASRLSGSCGPGGFS